LLYAPREFDCACPLLWGQVGEEVKFVGVKVLMALLRCEGRAERYDVERVDVERPRPRVGWLVVLATHDVRGLKTVSFVTADSAAAL
jgi:hypothetical protein